VKSLTRFVLLFAALAQVCGGILPWAPDQALAAPEARYLAAPGDLLDVAGVRLHVRDTGRKDAPAVILLHGFGSSLHTWEPWARLLETDHRVIRFDLPGSGLSGPDPQGVYTDARSMEIMTALMDRLGVAQASVIGHSIGGRLAWTFAARHPELLTRLVLVSPDGFASPGLAYGKKAEVPAMAQIMRYVLPKAVLRASLAAAYGDPAALTDATLDRYYDLMVAPGVRETLLARLEQTVLEDPEPILRTIKAPVLLVWGEKDGFIPVSNATDYTRNLTNCTLALLPGLGHVPFEEAPDISFPPVKAFLAR
jgi:pimeloyl-ACP methyl ester carboxylesterase